MTFIDLIVLNIAWLFGFKFSNEQNTINAYLVVGVIFLVTMLLLILFHRNIYDLGIMVIILGLPILSMLWGITVRLNKLKYGSANDEYFNKLLLWVKTKNNNKKEYK